MKSISNSVRLARTIRMNLDANCLLSIFLSCDWPTILLIRLVCRGWRRILDQYNPVWNLPYVQRSSNPWEVGLKCAQCSGAPLENQIQWFVSQSKTYVEVFCRQCEIYYCDTVLVPWIARVRKNWDHARLRFSDPEKICSGKSFTMTSSTVQHCWKLVNAMAVMSSTRHKLFRLYEELADRFDIQTVTGTLAFWPSKITFSGRYRNSNDCGSIILQ
jgi:hypothetical protein